MLELWPSTGRSRIWGRPYRDELEPALLMLALPHHVDALVADESIGFLDILRYRGGLKGMCRAVLGEQLEAGRATNKNRIHGT